MESETLVPFATAAENVAIVERRTSGGTMDLETLVTIAKSADAVSIVESGTSLTWELGRSTISSATLLVFYAETTSAKTALDSSKDRLAI